MGHGCMERSGLRVQLKLRETKKKEKRNAHFWRGIGSGLSRERREKISTFSLRYMEIRWSESVEPKFKVHLLDEGYAWVPTTCSFIKDFGFGEENLVREALPSGRRGYLEVGIMKRVELWP